MAKTLLNGPWIRQPQYPVSIDRSNKFGSRVLYVQLGSVPGRLICRDSPDILFTTNNAISGVNPTGKCLQTANASNSYAATANQSLFGGRSALSCFAIWSYSAQQNPADIVRKNSEFTPIQLNTVNTARAAIWRGGLVATSGLSVAANTEYRSLTRWKTGSNLEFFVSPSSSASIAVTAGISDTSAAAPLIFGAAENNTEWAATLQPLTIFFDSWISDAEYVELRANPWQIFQPIRRNLWAQSAAGGATTIDLTAAAFGFTAAAPQLAFSTALTAAGLTTAAQSVQTRLTTALTAAALNFTANAITLSGALVIALEAAALNLTTNAVQPALALALSAAASNLVANSVQPSVAIRLAAGTLTFTAQAITIIQNTLIELTAASLRFTALAVDVSGAVVTTVLRTLRTLRGFAMGRRPLDSGERS